MSFGQMRRYYGYRQAADVWGKTAEVYNPGTPSPQWSMLVGVLCCGDGNLIIVEGIMKKDGYVKILKEKESAAKLYVSAAASNRTTTQNTRCSWWRIFPWRPKWTLLTGLTWMLLKIWGLNWNPLHLEKLERFAKEELAGFAQETCER